MAANASDAPGAPGVPPTWSPGAKDAVATALGNSRVWATVGHGIVNEVYWPSAGDPQIRDLGFIVAGAGWWQEVKTLSNWTVTSLAADVPIPTLAHSGPGWSLSVELVPDPDRDVLLLAWTLQGVGVQLYPLLAPHLESHSDVDPADQGAVGADNSAWIGDHGELLAKRPGCALCLAASPVFARASSGYVGVSDGWQDFAQHGQMTWTWPSAGPGNVALMGETAASSGLLALSFANDADGAITLAHESLAVGVDAARASCAGAWQAWASQLQLPPATADDPAGLSAALQRSAVVIKAHEDHSYPGAFVASLSIPWGDHRSDLSGYHLVWPRDATECGLALLALGHFDDSLNLCDYLIATQQADGHWQQNFFPDATAFWTGTQLDETALPVMLAAKLLDGGHALPTGADQMVRDALGFLVANGPLTAQDRWEENPGGSPFTLATIVAALVGGVALLGNPRSSAPLTASEATYLLTLADNWNERIESWTYASGTDLDSHYGVDGHYVRIGPPPDGDPGAPWGPRGFVSLQNQPSGAAQIAASLLVGLEFFYLARMGLRAPDDKRVTDTVIVIEGELGQDVASGRAYHRYERDGYGETDDGGAYTGAGRGRLWPLLAGERGHFEVLCGRSASDQLSAMINMSGRGGLIPEQVWDAADIPDAGLIEGQPTGSAMPLVWAHAELVKLALSASTGRPVEQLDAVLARYGGKAPTATGPWYWRTQLDATTPAGGIDVLPRGRDLVIEDGDPFTLHWGHDGWQDVADVDAVALAFGRFGATLTAAQVAAFGSLQFTRRYPDHWEGSDHTLLLVEVMPDSLPASRSATGH